MAWYRTGTISVTQGSASVTGVGTTWLLGAGQGEALHAPDGKYYEILEVVSNTELTLVTPYPSISAGAQAYEIVPTQSYIRDLAREVESLVNAYSSGVEHLGSVSILAPTEGQVLTYRAGTWVNDVPTPGESITFAEISDSAILSPTTGQALIYNGSHWANATLPPTIDELNDIPDVSIVGLQSGHVIRWNGVAWVNSDKVGLLDTSFDNVEISELAAGDVLKFTGGKWRNSPLTTVTFNLNDLGDIVALAPSVGDLLQYNGTNWTSGPISSVGLTLTGLADVDISGQAAGDVLVFNGTDWENHADFNASTANLANVSISTLGMAVVAGDVTMTLDTTLAGKCCVLPAPGAVITVPANVLSAGNVIRFYNSSSYQIASFNAGAGMTLRRDGVIGSTNFSVAAATHVDLQFISATEAVAIGITAGAGGTPSSYNWTLPPLVTSATSFSVPASSANLDFKFGKYVNIGGIGLFNGSSQFNPATTGGVLQTTWADLNLTALNANSKYVQFKITSALTGMTRTCAGNVLPLNEWSGYIGFAAVTIADQALDLILNPLGVVGVCVVEMRVYEMDNGQLVFIDQSAPLTINFTA